MPFGAAGPTAHEEGFEAHHVAHRGWASLRDSALFARAIAEGFVFVTNNRRDFLDLAGRVDLHSGLIVILPAVRRERQIELFRIALAQAASLPSMVNTVVEIGDDGVPRGYELPTLEAAAGPGVAGPDAL